MAALHCPNDTIIASKQKKNTNLTSASDKVKGSENSKNTAQPKQANHYNTRLINSNINWFKNSKTIVVVKNRGNKQTHTHTHTTITLHLHA